MVDSRKWLSASTKRLTIDHRPSTIDYRLWRQWMQENATRPDEEAFEPASAGADAAEASGGDDWRARVEEEQARAEDFLARWQRAAADMSNMRRRHDLDRQEYTRQANATLVRDLLQVLDSFDGALATIPADARDTPWVGGVLQVERQLRSILERNGLTAIEAQGQPFDPTLHEALMQEESDQPADTVIGELQRGYKLHDRVLRPSMVKVAQ